MNLTSRACPGLASCMVSAIIVKEGLSSDFLTFTLNIGP